MRFQPGSDDDEYFATCDALLDEMADWLPDSPGSDDSEIIGDAGIFLDWRYFHSTGVLDEFDDGDVTEFLLDWCPRKWSAPADDSPGMCRAVSLVIEFLASTGRLVGGVDRAARLMTLVADVEPKMHALMGDPSMFGMAKTLFADLIPVADSMTEEELHAALRARMDEFNAQPYEHRRALTDRFMNPPLQPLELPFIHIPPSAADVEAVATAAVLPAKVDRLREYLGPAGKPLTQRGNLKLADGRALIELLDTGDVMDPDIGGRTWRTGSTENLRVLGFIVGIAKQAGAVRVHQRRLVPVKAWARRTPVERATALFRTIMELGALWSPRGRQSWLFEDMRDLLEEGIAHWLAPLLEQETEVLFDGILEMAKAVVAEQIAPDWPQWPVESLNALTEYDVSRVFEVLEMAGIVDWTDTEQIPTRFGDNYRAGGAIALTALGRHVIPDYLPEAGYLLRRIDDLADADAAALIEAFDSVPDTEHEALLAAWQPARSPAERVDMIVAAIAAADSARSRLIGFVILEMFDRDVVAPIARQLLDSPAAGHAALWLISHGLADPDTLGSFVDIGVLVDVLAAALDDPEELCELFTQPAPRSPEALLDEMWRHPGPETAAVLDALGEHLPDSKLAKAARKAAIRHRSWMANRH